MTPSLLTSVEGERFLHKDLWLVAKRQVAHAVETPKGAFYDHLAAMVFAFNALEAYLNYLGSKIDPTLWQSERDYFRKEPYRGFDGKIRKIYEMVTLAEPPRSLRPYESVWLLKGLRDLIAHGKVEAVKLEVEHDASWQLPMFLPTEIDELVNGPNAARAIEDIEIVAQCLHDAASPMISDSMFGKFAFSGPLRHNAHTTRAKD